MDKAMMEILEFVEKSPHDIVKIALLYLEPADQKVVLAGFEQLEKEKGLSPAERAAKAVLEAGVLEDVRRLVAEFAEEHGLSIDAPLPPLIENDALNLGAELKAELEVKENSDSPPDLGDTNNHSGDGQNGGDNNAGDSNGPDDDHKEGEVIEGEHAR